MAKLTPGEGALGALCVAIVRDAADCGCCAFPVNGSCSANLVWGESSPGRFVTIKLPLPDFVANDPEATGPQPLLGQQHAVCVRRPPVAAASAGAPAQGCSAFVAGATAYYYRPHVRFLDSLVRVGVRSFLNPGWHEEVQLQCRNCSKTSRLVIRPLAPNSRCQGLIQQELAAVVAASQEAQLPPDAVATGGIVHGKNGMGALHPARRLPSALALPAMLDEPFAAMAASGLRAILPRTKPDGADSSAFSDCALVDRGGPCRGYANEGSFTVAPPVAFVEGPDGFSAASFQVDGHTRLHTKERQALFHRRSAVCFFPEAGVPEGWLVGFALVHVDGPDMQAFVGFVCFFGVALPLICLITALLHYNKYERCRQHIRQVRLDYQREQLNEELRPQGGSRGGARRSGAPSAGSGFPRS
eukprot:TRINITY_DN46694_c0_g1_i1.p1 TRINITY_DN46694_c0_g1~~TRINITY_DN46694_c0_g1_i1.p1  ORF type:complete len:485 (-),score=106.08 TRINITY_DN46694_c0_g1_i1:56-1300(-)